MLMRESRGYQRRRLSRCDQAKNRTRKALKETVYVQGIIVIKLIHALARRFHKDYRRGLLGGLLGAGMGGGASCRSVGASSRVSVALRIALRNRLPRFGTVLW